MRTLLLTSAIALLLPGCYSAGLGSKTRSEWVLVKVEYLPEHAANAGVMPTFRAAGGAGFAGPPVARGSLRLAESGNATCSVRFEEPVVGFSGKLAIQRYDVVALFGTLSEGGDRIAARSAAGGDVPLGVPTELLLRRESDVVLRAHPSSRGRLAPYVFVFSADAAAERPVEIPTVP